MTPEQRAVKAIDDAYALDGVTAEQAAAALDINPYRAAPLIADAIRAAVNDALERAAKVADAMPNGCSAMHSQSEFGTWSSYGAGRADAAADIRRMKASASGNTHPA